ncbi:AraC family transcriptional regulator [Streptomyces sp. NPDC002133]|uniref:AraC family transcriptional regulator n=1 Tax=Streptomyces sp. NPDC002133 TaxID=3154409 RepID=UPI00331DC8C6
MRGDTTAAESARELRCDAVEEWPVALCLRTGPWARRVPPKAGTRPLSPPAEEQTDLKGQGYDRAVRDEWVVAEEAFQAADVARTIAGESAGRLFPTGLDFDEWLKGPRSRDLARLCRVRDRIDREYTQPPDVEGLARGVNMSVGYFSREFRAVSGEAPCRHLMTRRIERASPATSSRPRNGPR